jgi:hypothetical protein
MMGDSTGEWSAWHKSSYSSKGDCLEVRYSPDLVQVQVRNSKKPDGSVLVIGQKSWESFLTRVKNGEFDLPSSA